MSYCRFAEGDVYAYECDSGVQFYVSDGKRELDRLCSTFNEAYQYARVLRDTHGLDVPSHAIEALKADALEEAARICGPDSAVAELESENAKLREQNRYLMKGDLLHVLTDQEYIDQCERERLMQVSIDALDKENAELRELVQELWEGYMDPPCEDCPLKDKPACADCPICAREAAVIDRMRELGIEVNG